jgi:hypothetical protein
VCNRPIAKRFRLADREFALKAQALGPGEQVLRDQRQLEPDGVEVELAEREVLKADLLRAADQVLGITSAAVQPLDLDHVAGEVGERRLEAVSLVIGELQLRAGVRALAGDDHRDRDIPVTEADSTGTKRDL